MRIKRIRNKFLKYLHVYSQRKYTIQKKNQKEYIYSNLIKKAKNSLSNKIESEYQRDNMFKVIMITNHSCCNNSSSRYGIIIDLQI